MVSSSEVISTFSTPSSNNDFMSQNQTRSRSASDPGRLQTEAEDELESRLRQAVIGSQLPSAFFQQSSGFDSSGVMSQNKMNPKLEVNPASVKAGEKTVSQCRTAVNVSIPVKTYNESKMIPSTKTMPKPKPTVNIKERSNTRNSSVDKPTTNLNRPKTTPMTKLERNLEGDLSALSEEQLKALAHPSTSHIKIAFLNTCNGAEASAPPEIVFESYPLPLLEFISPKAHGILARRVGGLMGAGNGFKQDTSSRGKQAASKVVNDKDNKDSADAKDTNIRRVSYADIAASTSTSSNLALEPGNPAVVETVAVAVKATPTPTPTPTTKAPTGIKPPTGIILPTAAPRALQLLLEYALISCTPKPVQPSTTTTCPTPTSTTQNIGPHTPPAAAHLSIPLPHHAFYKYARITEEARFLGCTWLEDLLVRRMRKIAGGQVHTNCLERILKNSDGLRVGVATRSGGKGGEGEGSSAAGFGGSESGSGIGNAGAAGVSGVSGVSGGSIHGPSVGGPSVNGHSGAGHPIGARAAPPPGKGRGAWFRRIAVESIAKAIFDGRLQYAFKYERLREEYPEFDRELVWKIGELERQAARRRGVGNGRRGSGKGD